MGEAERLAAIAVGEMRRTFVANGWKAVDAAELKRVCMTALAELRKREWSDADGCASCLRGRVAGHAVGCDSERIMFELELTALESEPGAKGWTVEPPK